MSVIKGQVELVLLCEKKEKFEKSNFALRTVFTMIFFFFIFLFFGKGTFTSGLIMKCNPVSIECHWIAVMSCISIKCSRKSLSYI
jgi:hypothetical protein